MGGRILRNTHYDGAKRTAGALSALRQAKNAVERDIRAYANMHNIVAAL